MPPQHRLRTALAVVLGACLAAYFATRGLPPPAPPPGVACASAAQCSAWQACVGGACVDADVGGALAAAQAAARGLVAAVAQAPCVFTAPISADDLATFVPCSFSSARVVSACAPFFPPPAGGQPAGGLPPVCFWVDVAAAAGGRPPGWSAGVAAALESGAAAFARLAPSYAPAAGYFGAVAAASPADPGLVAVALAGARVRGAAGDAAAQAVAEVAAAAWAGAPPPSELEPLDLAVAVDVQAMQAWAAAVAAAEVAVASTASDLLAALGAQ